jgi:hypothetical protein
MGKTISRFLYLFGKLNIPNNFIRWIPIIPQSSVHIGVAQRCSISAAARLLTFLSATSNSLSSSGLSSESTPTQWTEFFVPRA